MGWTYDYNGFALKQDPAVNQGEYVWRVKQDDAVASTIDSKLGAFYAYSGYYYASTESGSLQMSNPSSTVNHRRIFSFMGSDLPSATVMESPINSSSSTAFKQRPASAFASSLADITASDPDTVNQMIISYQTNEDGETVVSSAATGFVGILKVLAMNRTDTLATVPSYLRFKEFQTWYWTTPDDLTPNNSFSYGAIFSGNLDDFDYRDPELQ